MGLLAEDDFFAVPGLTSWPWPTSTIVGPIVNGAQEQNGPLGIGVQGGVWITPTPSLGQPPSSQNQGASTGESYLYDFYDRIWVLPPTLFSRNPTLNANISFRIWNAFFRTPTNTLNSVAALGSGVSDVALQFVAPQTYTSLELRTVALQVVVNDPTPININYIFTFGSGAGAFNFQAIQSTVLTILPEIPVMETWLWKTDMQVSFDGTEQRQGILPTPRREIEYDMLILQDSEYQNQLQSLYSQLGSRIVIPFFQYATEITAPTGLGNSRIYFDPARSDMRQDELVYIIGANGTEMATITTLFTDGILMSFPLTFDLLPNDIIMPAASTYVANGTKIAMKPVLEGNIRVLGRVLDFRASLTRPGSNSTFQSLGGAIIVDRRPLNNKDTDTGIDTGAQLFDYQSGPLDQISYWNANRMVGDRQFLIQRIFSPSEMDWWRDFLGLATGMLNVFLMPTWRPDLTISTAPGDATTSLVVKGNSYSQNYFLHSTSFRAVCVETSSGIYYSAVLSATPDGLGNDVLSLGTAAPTGAGYRTIKNISFLVKCRLGSDRVVLEHSALFTLLTLTIRSTEQ